MIHDDDVALLNMIADTISPTRSPSILFGNPSPKSTSPTALFLVNFLILILFFLMSIQVMEIIQENFHYS